MKMRNVSLALFVLVILLVLGYFLIYNKQRSSQYPQYPFKKIVTKEFVVKNDNMTIDVKYPYLGGGAVDKAIDKFIKSETSVFIKLNNIKLSHNWKNELYITYDNSFFNAQFISFKFEVYQFTGGAHGNTRLRTFVFNIDNGNESKLSMFFDKKTDYLKFLSDKCRGKLIEQLGKMADEKWVNEGTLPKEDNFKDFIFTPGSIVIFFEQYQVAPYSSGIQQVEIPLNEIIRYLVPSMAKKIGAR